MDEAPPNSGWPRQSLEALEGDDWGDATFDSHLVRECHRLRRVPLADLSAENLRILIGQQIGLRYLVPMALDLLRRDPFAAGDFYPGDLLMSVLRVESGFWRAHPELCQPADETARRALDRLSTLEEDDQELREMLSNAHDLFSQALA